MENENIRTLSLNDFFKEIAVNGMFLKYMTLKEEANIQSCEGVNISKTYILKDTSSDLYKIGKTSDLKKRLQSLKCGNPFISLFAVIDFDCESELHKLFDSKRFEGEWFRLTDEDIECVVQTYNASLK